MLHAGDHIDLHLHTTYSDGHWRPADLFTHLGEANFSVVAVTDHDAIDHLDEMRRFHHALENLDAIPDLLAEESE